MDDVLVFGKDKAEHDERLVKVLKRLQSAGITLNRSKCEFQSSSVTFLGHLIDSRGIQADPDKTAAIQEMERPRS
jgi:ribosome assembly protein YihI (activator of Der GTPase)